MAHDEQTTRTPPAEAVEEARRQPGGWVYEVVGGEAADGSVPPERIKGAWKVDADGQITGEFRPNPSFIEP